MVIDKIKQAHPDDWEDILAEMDDEEEVAREDAMTEQRKEEDTK